MGVTALVCAHVAIPAGNVTHGDCSRDTPSSDVAGARTFRRRTVRRRASRRGPRLSEAGPSRVDPSRTPEYERATGIAPGAGADRGVGPTSARATRATWLRCGAGRRGVGPH